MLLFNKWKYVYIHIDELNRDSVVASALKQELAERGVKLIYGNRHYSNYLIRYFAKYFDAVVFPKPHFLRYFDKNCFNETKVIMLYTENIGIIADSGVDKMTLKGALDEEFMSGDSSYVDMVDAFCFWGKLVHDTVVRHHSNLKDKCYVVGHPRHSKQTLKLKNHQVNSSKKKEIGILTRQVFLNDYMERNQLEKLAQYLDNSSIYEYYNHKTQDFLISTRRGSSPENDAFSEAVDVKYIFLIINTALKNNHNVSIKTHPREKAETWKVLFDKFEIKVKFVDPLTPLTHWISDLDYLIGPPSSSFYDSMMMGVTPISIHNLDKRRKQFDLPISEENNHLMPHVYSPKSLEELFSFIDSNKRTEHTEEIYAVLEAEADYPFCNNSINKISNIICDVLNNREDKRIIEQTLGIAIYNIASVIFNIIFFMRYFTSVKHSASFIVSRKVGKFINKLAS